VPYSLELIYKILGLFQWDDQPENQVKQQAWHTAGYEGNQESQPDPKSVDTKEICQSAANSQEDTVSPGAP
jgi:hypothetical protein